MSRRRHLRIAGITTVVISLLVAAIYGIIGNRADYLYLTIISVVEKIKISDPTPWFVTCGILLLSVIIILLVWRYNRILNHAYSTTNNMLTIDDTILRLLASWIPSQDHKTEMKLLLADLLEEVCEEFDGHVHRASILLPEGDYLKIWAHHGMPETSIIRNKFYIGNDRSKSHERGIAGEAYRKQELHITHIRKENNTWRCSSSHFIRFSGGNHTPPYRTFACVPIVGAGLNPAAGDLTICHGIICFDSMTPEIFDEPESQTILRFFARRIAATLLIYKLLLQLKNPST